MNLRNHDTTKQIELVLRLSEIISQKQRLWEDGFPATT